VVFIFQDIQKIYRFEYVLQLRNDARISSGTFVFYFLHDKDKSTIYN
jgi:hypothetical protein